MYLKFVKWDGENAIFIKATIVDHIIVGSGLALLSRLFSVKEGDIIIIKAPNRIEDGIREYKSPIDMNGHWNCGVCGCSHKTYGRASNCNHGK